MEDGYISGAVPRGTRPLEVQNEALSMYSRSNPLHPEIWPSLRKYEAEIISMTASFLNGGLQMCVGPYLRRHGKYHDGCQGTP